ncbi:hypothetical protein SEEM030_02320 [Salmonella enterica subsp. enterica serovar Montevideo str. SARB30]|nr:hypothetical protein SEEM030_02320 [Salmonella enterica subsp. enterica serovar Montevideo str. SARB30]ESF40001.1 hypothetical protein SEES8400_06496 [Salmonella enterica subsp. enterica serovar Senftenberg str. ATCC 8400]ESF67632.1 hypothetical protein SEEPBA42_12053 [Salmonella enterica subsp. enterica serovar Paratyphi B str. SARA42]
MEPIAIASTTSSSENPRVVIDTWRPRYARIA